MVDTLVLETSARKGVEVRLLSSVPVPVAQRIEQWSFKP